MGGTVLWGATFMEPGVSELTQDLSRNDHLFEIGEIDGSIGPALRRWPKCWATWAPPPCLTA